VAVVVVVVVVVCVWGGGFRWVWGLAKPTPKRRAIEYRGTRGDAQCKTTAGNPSTRAHLPTGACSHRAKCRTPSTHLAAAQAT
jgi:hypothetical protein